jgi:hypothetical protein
MKIAHHSDPNDYGGTPAFEDLIDVCWFEEAAAALEENDEVRLTGEEAIAVARYLPVRFELTPIGGDRWVVTLDREYAREELMTAQIEAEYEASLIGEEAKAREWGVGGSDSEAA